MKIARFVIFGIAVAAGGGAALPAGRSDAAPPAPPPVVSIDTVEFLVAVRDISIGQVIEAADIGWLAWPAASAIPSVHKKDETDAIEQLAGRIARVPTANGEPVRKNNLGQAVGEKNSQRVVFGKTLELTQRQAGTRDGAPHGHAVTGAAQFARFRSEEATGGPPARGDFNRSGQPGPLWWDHHDHPQIT